MKLTHKLLVVALASTTLLSANAQISFDNNYLLSRAGEVIDQSFYDRSDLNLSPLDPAELNIITDIVENRVGPNQTYDFSGISYNLRGTIQFAFHTSTTGLPGAGDPAFATANFASSAVIPGFGETHLYYDLSADALSQLGAFAQTTFGDQLITYTPPFLEMALPLTDGTTWTSPQNSSLGFSADLEANVEGYGTLILPGGIEAEALRVRRIITDELAPGFAMVSTTYEFLTLEGHIATIEFDQQVLQPEELYAISYTDASGIATSNESADELPERSNLGQNYPNPFNPSTVIPFDVSAAGPVALRVYDTLGRHVASVFEGTLAAGRHEMAWRPVGLPGGVYFYRLESSGQSVTRSLQLLK
jgi:hypothetical protein